MITSQSTTDKHETMMDSAGESPLDVLSRAATMVQQENQQATLDESSKSQKQITKWKRDRRRPPEYSRKSDPKIPETLGVGPSSPEASISNGSSSSNGSDAPLDMTIRQRGLPPSYAQTISNPGYRSSYRPPIASVNGGLHNREELPSGISMCDPIIDEHFRRSLGNDYHTLFLNNQNQSKEKEPPKSPPAQQKSPVIAQTTNVIHLMDTAGMSVDDHFAKALGDTWVKLNNKKDEIKSTSNGEGNLVSISN